jgi:hypothetical protein
MATKVISESLHDFVSDPRNRAILRRANRSTGQHAFEIRLYAYAPLKGEVKPWTVSPLRTCALLLDAYSQAHEPGAKPGLFVAKLFPKDFGTEFEKAANRLSRSSRETACNLLERRLYLARKFGFTVDLNLFYNDLKYWTNGQRCTAIKWFIDSTAEAIVE